MKKHYFIGLIIPLLLLLLIPAKAMADSCFTDDFERVTLGTNWTVSNSCGGCYTPAIVNNNGNRLRLTPASPNVATTASLNIVFPAAGNIITIEFDHFAYNGTGADGIAVTLSDSAVTPVPGAFGGSLGYAQKSNPGSDCTVPGGCPGFAGGWIGIGLDEYGNFSNPTEGRILGPGQRSDSVSIRGSGSGMTGYIFHINTGTAALVPGIDSTVAPPAPPGPGYRYRIIIDHTNSVNAWVSVWRDTTGTGTYTQLIPPPPLYTPYDALAQAGQAAVPTGWWLSFTGSTGGANNTHEIDNLSICTPGGGIKIIKWREVIQ